ncbi:protease, partial [Streptomyces sp. SID4917]|nr:protease [Streptomyces sp. SID4917]
SGSGEHAPGPTLAAPADQLAASADQASVPQGRPQPLHEPDEYSTPPYGGPGPWAPAPPVQLPTPAHGTPLPPLYAGQQAGQQGPQSYPPPQPHQPQHQQPHQHQPQHQQPQPSQWVQYDPWNT